MSSTSALSASFNDFLFATVCEERNDMPLTVVSALARLDLDPWTEAAELARMPADGAARRLAALLAGVAGASPATTAARLVALLPNPAKADVSFRGRAARVMTVRSALAVRIVFMLFMASLAVSVLISNLAPRGALPPPAHAPAHAATAPR
jgi:hypothetical protein